MGENDQVLVGGTASGRTLGIELGMANRHGLISGATGTGKTVSLQLLAEGFSAHGVPVFAADVKGDLSGLCRPNSYGEKIKERVEKLKIANYSPNGSPVIFWDLYGKLGHPIRTTISEMGPLLLSRLLELNDNQQGLLEMAFSIADDQGLMLLDLKDLKSVLQWMGEHTSELRTEYGNVSQQSVGAVIRKLLSLNNRGGEQFFGEPALQLEHLMQRDLSGRGVINLLDATTTISDPRLYTTFLLWLLSELFEQLDECGDLEKPRLVFFFDEAHLLFNDAPKALMEKIEQVVRLIRSKGVGVYFVSQHPMDIPEVVLGQLGHKIQHALRAFTPKDQKALKSAAQTFRQNPELDTELLISELAIGEALVSLLSRDGVPEMVQRVICAPPRSKIGGLDVQERQVQFSNSPIKGIYEQVVDRESAYEILQQRAKHESQPLDAIKTPKPIKNENPQQTVSRKSTSNRQGVGEAFVTSMARSVGSSLGRSILRGLMGSILGKR